MDHDDALRRLYEKNAPPPAPPSDEHPSPEALAALARGDGAEAERLRSLDHVMACPTCRDELELLRAIATAEAREPSAKRLQPFWLPIAASIVAVAAIGVLLPWLRREDPIRGGSGGAPLLVLPNDNAPAMPSRFIWHEVRGVELYRFELVRADGIRAAMTETRDTIATVADSVAAAPKAEYRWWVTALKGDGTQVRSETRRLDTRAR